MRAFSGAVLGVTAAWFCAAPAGADPVVIGSVTANAPIAAQGGWVVWSAPTGSRWQLMGWHDGVAAPVPIAPRSQPFDVDLGTDAAGRVVATFSRCRRAPRLGFDRRTDPWTGGGCHIRVLDLASGAERRAPVPAAAGMSDTTPSMWHGRIAFSRRGPPDGRKQISQVLLWSPRGGIVRLHHGALPRGCPFSTSCRSEPVHGHVEGLDLGARVASFLWFVDAPGVVGHGGWEVRSDRLDDGTTRVVGAGFAGEACTGGVDGVGVGLPTSDGADVWFSTSDAECHVQRSFQARVGARTGLGRRGPLDGDVQQSVKDGDSLVVLMAPTSAGEEGWTCQVPGAPCTIERIGVPSLTEPFGPAQSPFYS